MSVIVIGAGHNGLTCAALLAKAGRKVTLLEARDRIGGLAAKEDFGDGYAVPGILHDTRGVREQVVDSLGLAQFGLKRAEKSLRIAAPRADGSTLWLEGDVMEGEQSAKDADYYRGYREFIARVGPTLRRLLDQPPPDPAGSLWPLLKTGIGVRRLGAVDMVELARVAPMAVADWMRDLFEEERVGAAIAAGAIEATFFGPWSAGTALTLLLREAVALREIVGGAAAVSDALRQAAEAQGVTIRCAAPVRKIRATSTGVEGVVLDSGEQLDATCVVSSCDPKQTFLELVGSNRIPVRLADDIRALRARGTTAKVHLALNGPLELSDGTEIAALRSGDTLDQIERAFDAVKYRGFSERPVLDVRVPSQDDATLCPEGHHVVSIMVHYAAYALEGGWTDEQRDALGDNVVRELVRYCPSVRERIVEREVLTPHDLAERYRLTNGHLHHGEHAADQLLFMRPSVDCADYTTPIPGLFLCGSGSHPGGGVTCAPGALAAKAILRA